MMPPTDTGEKVWSRNKKDSSVLCMQNVHMDFLCQAINTPMDA